MSTPVVNAAPLILPRSEHSISRKAIHTNALKVLYRLDRSGQAAYLVGGAVRDHLLGRQPKDYDVATDARPPQIRRLFRNSRIIGRRFRLAHVYFKEGIIEVSTFRRDPDPKSQRGAPDELLITDDNVFGTPREDAFRRDFTVNALFYSIADFSVIDFVGGIEDLRKRQIKAIGDAGVRFQEDPVRMMRACELAGRLGLTIERDTQEALHDHRYQIDKAAPARLAEEFLGLLRSGSSAAAVQWMLELGLLDVVLPELATAVAGAERGLGYHRILAAIDGLVADGRELNDNILFGALILPAVGLDLLELEDDGRRRLKAARRREVVANRVVPFAARFRLSKLRGDRLIDTLLSTQRLSEGGWKLPDRIRFAQRPVFDDALALFEAVVLATSEGAEELETWRGIRQAHRDSPSGRPRRGRPRRRRRRRR